MAEKAEFQVHQVILFLRSKHFWHQPLRHQPHRQQHLMLATKAIWFDFLKFFLRSVHILLDLKLFFRELRIFQKQFLWHFHFCTEMKLILRVVLIGLSLGLGWLKILRLFMVLIRTYLQMFARIWLIMWAVIIAKPYQCVSICKLEKIWFSKTDFRMFYFFDG